MKRLLIFLFFLNTTQFAIAQHGLLFVKKGIRKMKTYTEGDRVMLKGNDHYIYAGTITMLRDDTIFINWLPLARSAVSDVILNRKRKSFHIDPGQLLLITGGVALVTAGLTISNQADFQEALIAGGVIGYGPLLLSYAGSRISLKRKRYRIGRRFRLQVIDFYLPYKAF